MRHRASGWQPPYLLPDPSHNRQSHPLPESSCGPSALQDLLLDQQQPAAATEPGHHTLGALALPLLGCPLKATGHELCRPLAGPTFKEQKDQLVLSLGNSLNFWGPQFPFS